MKTTDYLDLVKEKQGITSDYALGKLTGWSRAAISQYRTMPRYMSDKHAFQVAEFLDIEPAQVIANVHAEREKSPELKKMWKQIAKQFGTAAVVTLMIAPTFTPAPGSQNNLVLVENHSVPKVYIMLNKRRGS